jgi:aminopeptidase N
MQLRDQNDFGRMLDEWKHQAKPVRGWGSVYLAHAVAGDQFQDYQALLYAKGPLVLHALRQEIGDQAFFTIFKSVVSSFPMKDATTKDVIAITNLVTKKDYGPWFERYLLGPEWPPLEKGKLD